MNKELIVVKGKVIEQEKGFTAESGKLINYEAGAKQAKRHYDENPDDVVAHFVGKNRIEQILAQPGCIGIRSFHGLNELGIRTLILVGVDKDGKSILNVEETGPQGTLTKEAVIVNSNYMCPPKCPSIETSSGWMS